MKQLKSLLLHPFFQGSFIFTALSFVASVLSYVFNLVVARLVSVDQYGEYSSALSYFTLFSVVFGAFSLILVQRIGAVELKKQKEYVISLEKALFQYVKEKLGVIMIAAIGTGALLYAVSNMLPMSIIFVMSLVAVSFFMTIYAAIFQAKKEFFFAGGFLCALALFKVIGGGIAIFVHSQLWSLYAVVILSHVLIILIGRYHLHTQQVEAKPIALPRLRSVFVRPSVYLPLITFLGLTAMGSLDLILVKRFFSPHDAGYYAALSLLGRIILYVSLPLVAVAFSFFTGSETKKNSQNVLWVTIGAFLLLGVVSTIGYALLPNLVVGIIFGAQYVSIVPMVWIAAIYGSAYSLATLLGQYWIAQHHPISMLSLGSAIIQLILLLLFHQSFITVLLISIACSTILSVMYLTALFFVKRQPYEASA